MGLWISRLLAKMEGQQSRSCTCGANQPDNSNNLFAPPAPSPLMDDEEFHKSKWLRIILGISLVLQTAGGVFLGAVVIMNPGYNYDFVEGLAHFLIGVLVLPYIYVNLHWFLCIYYNRSLPYHKLFLILEICTAAPLILAVIIVGVIAIGSVITALAWSGRYYRVENIIILVLYFVIAVFAIWSLFWTFVYFLRTRGPEVIRLFKLGRKRESEDQSNGDIRGGAAVTEDHRDVNDADSNSDDAPLLIDNVV
ncbi:hypothetical protein ABW19_dt0207222 [Dactylella cylindrospora]|nr:hypothetical protein ABW19_dt0207222 [Dactylella cylindrospora]